MVPSRVNATPNHTAGAGRDLVSYVALFVAGPACAWIHRESCPAGHVRKAKDMTTTGGGDTARRVEKASTPSSAQKQCATQKQARRFDLAHRLAVAHGFLVLSLIFNPAGQPTATRPRPDPKPLPVPFRCPRAGQQYVQRQHHVHAFPVLPPSLSFCSSLD